MAIAIIEKFKAVSSLRTKREDRRRPVFLFLKLLVAAILLWFATRNVDHVSFARVWSSISPLHVLLASLAIVAGQFIAALRWVLILHHWNIALTIWQAFKLNLTGLFFNLVLPGTVGGDVVRIALLSRFHGRTLEAATSVLLTRVVGFLVLLGVGVIAGLAFSSTIMPRLVVWIFATGSVGAVVAAYGVLRSTWLERWLERTRSGFGRSIQQAIEALRSLGENRAVVSGIVLLSLAIQLVSIHAYYEAGRGLGIGLSWIDCLRIMPIAMMALAVPITIFGLGVRENVLMIMLGTLGIGEASAVALAIVWLMAYAMACAFSGIAFLTLDAKFFIGGNPDSTDSIPRNDKHTDVPQRSVGE
jgi:glycosyltransferase 2 family protein